MRDRYFQVFETFITIRKTAEKRAQLRMVQRGRLSYQRQVFEVRYKSMNVVSEAVEDGYEVNFDNKLLKPGKMLDAEQVVESPDDSFGIP